VIRDHPRPHPFSGRARLAASAIIAFSKAFTSGREFVHGATHSGLQVLGLLTGLRRCEVLEVVTVN
jgi:hypothetical protein